VLVPSARVLFAVVGAFVVPSLPLLELLACAGLVAGALEVPVPGGFVEGGNAGGLSAWVRTIGRWPGR
jgi:hypothetical protein